MLNSNLSNEAIAPGTLDLLAYGILKRQNGVTFGAGSKQMVAIKQGFALS